MPINRILSTLLISILFISCHKKQEIKYTDPLIVDSILNNFKLTDEAVKSENHFIKLNEQLSLLNLSPEDQYKVYKYKESKCQNILFDFKCGSAYADSMLYIAKNNELKYESDKLFHAYMTKAATLYGLERYDESYTNFAIAQYIADTVSSPFIKSKYLFKMGMACYSEEEYLDAARLFVETNTKYNQTNIVNDYSKEYFNQEALANAGLAYTMADMADSGLYFYKKALDYIELKKTKYPHKTNDWEEARSVILGNMASLFKRNNNIDSAEYYFRQSIAISKLIGRNIKDRQYNQIKLADLLLDKKNTSEAKVLLDEVERSKQIEHIINKDDSLELAKRYTEICSRYQMETKNYNKAYTLLKQQQALEEQQKKHAQKRLLNNMENGIDNAGHENRILLLEKNNQIKAQRTTILLLLCLICLTGIGVTFHFLRRRIKDIKHLRIQNTEIISSSNLLQQELEQKNKRDRANYLALLENTDDCLWSLDKDYNILAFNKIYKEHMLALSGKTPVIGEKDLLTFISPEFFKTILEGYKIAFSGESFTAIEKGLGKAGEAPDVAMKFNPIKNENGDVIGITCSRKDMTEYFNLIDSLKKNTLQLESIAWAQSHVLRGPLTTIIGIANVLYDSNEHLEPEVKQELITGMKQKLLELDNVVKTIVSMTHP